MKQNNYSYTDYVLMGAAGIFVHAPWETIKGIGILVTAPFYLVGRGLKENDPMCMDQPKSQIKREKVESFYESVYK